MFVIWRWRQEDNDIRLALFWRNSRDPMNNSGLIAWHRRRDVERLCVCLFRPSLLGGWCCDAAQHAGFRYTTRPVLTASNSVTQSGPSSSLSRSCPECLREQAGIKYLAHSNAVLGRVYATAVPSVWALLCKSVLTPSTAVQQHFVYRATLGNQPLLRYTDNSQACAHLRRSSLAA